METFVQLSPKITLFCVLLQLLFINHPKTNDNNNNGYRGAFYASKDFYDPVGDRRILWGWAQVPPASVQTLPREILWDAHLQQLVFVPIEEQQQLRDVKVVDVTDPVALQPNQTMPLGPFPGSQGNQSEVEVVFALPEAESTFGVVVMAEDDPSKSGTLFYVKTPAERDDDASTYEVTVGSVALPLPTYGREMDGVDLPGNGSGLLCLYLCTVHLRI